MLVRWLDRAEEGLLALLLAAMTLLTFSQVVMRYVFNSGFVWALEADTYLFGWLILLGASYAVRVHAHVGVDAAVKLLRPAPRRLVGLLAVLLCLLYAALMAYGAWGYVGRLRRLGITAEDIPVQRWILSLVLPLGFLMLGVRLVEQARRIVKGEAASLELGDEADELLRERARERLAERRG
jgi:C4-dicarboxylate transporter DctQ subunit